MIHRTRSRSILAQACAGVVAAFALALDQAQAAAPVYDWDRVANVKDAAKQIGEIQAAQGADKAFLFITNCYKTHGLGSTFSKYFEACIAQDLMLMEALAAIYSRVDPEALRKSGSPSVPQLQAALNQRLGGAYASYNIAPGEVQALKKIVDTHGMPVFLRIVFPKASANDNEPRKKQ